MSANWSDASAQGTFRLCASLFSSTNYQGSSALKATKNIYFVVQNAAALPLSFDAKNSNFCG